MCEIVSKSLWKCVSTWSNGNWASMQFICQTKWFKKKWHLSTVHINISYNINVHEHIWTLLWSYSVGKICWKTIPCTKWELDFSVVLILVSTSYQWCFPCWRYCSALLPTQSAEVHKLVARILCEYFSTIYAYRCKWMLDLDRISHSRSKKRLTW